MPKCTLVVPYDKFHGRILDALGGSGQVIFSSARAGNVTRKYVVPANPQTTLQLRVRNALAQCAAAYAALSESNRNAWIAAAGQIERSNILDLNYTLSGIAFYCMVNAYRILGANSPVLVETPPSLSLPTPPQGITSVGFNAAGDNNAIVIDFSGAPDGQRVQARITDPITSPNRIPRANDYGYGSENSVQSFAVVSDESAAVIFDNDFRQIQTDDQVYVEVTPITAAGMPGSPVRFGPITVTAI